MNSVWDYISSSCGKGDVLKTGGVQSVGGKYIQLHCLHEFDLNLYQNSDMYVANFASVHLWHYQQQK